MEKELIEHHTRLLVTIANLTPPVEGRNANRDKKYEEIFTLHRLASATGGAYTHGLSSGLIEFAWTGYLLGIKLPASLDKPKSWKLQLLGAAAKAHKNALIYQPFDLAPCGSTTTAVAH